MLRSWLTLRAVVGVVSVGLIAAGVARMVELTPERPSGTWRDIQGLADRDDLNVVFVMVDTLRADRLSAYGYERETSPIFDLLAEGGILFRDVTAQSTWTKTSMASLWTATHPSTNHIERYPDALPDAATTPAEIFQRAGYRTVGIYRNGWVAPNFGFAQGFDLYMNPMIQQDSPRVENPSASLLPGTDVEVTHAGMEFLRRADREERFFLYLHYMDVHQYVYDGTVDFGTTYSDIYDNSIRWVDRNLESVVAALQQEGLLDRTLVVVSSDHGEAFGEHSVEGHARNLYRETTGVPLMISLPFRLEEGIEVDVPVENVDLWPTVLDMVGLPAIPEAEGRSLLPLIEAAARGEAPPEEARPRFAYLDQAWGSTDAEPRPHFTVAEDGFRLFHWTRNPEAAKLYDVEADFYEQRDIAAQHPERVEALVERVETYAEGSPLSWGEPDEVALDDMELDQLRALGYAVGGEDPRERGAIDTEERERAPRTMTLPQE